MLESPVARNFGPWSAGILGGELWVEGAGLEPAEAEREGEGVGRATGGPGPVGDGWAGSVGRLALTALACVISFAGCGDAAGPGGVPRRVERVSAAVDSVGIGDTLRQPIEVRVEDAAGDPVAGVDVRFRVVGEADGRVQAGVVSADADGRARTRFVAGGRIGAATVRADLPSHPEVGGVGFTLRTVIPRTTLLAGLSGDGQRAEVSSQLPRPMEVRVTTRDSVPVAGVPVYWRVASAAGEGAALTVDTAFTGREGRSRALLTLGERPGEYRVTARSRGGAEAVSFTATAVDSIDSGMRLDSVRPVPLRTGETARLYGAGLGRGPGTDVRVEGVGAEVLEEGSGRIRIRVPASFAERCLPARDVGVRVLAGDAQSNGRTVRLDPAEPPISLEPGESRVIPAGAAPACLRFAADTAARLYRVAVQSAGRTEAVTAVRLTGRSGTDPYTAAADGATRVLGIPKRSDHLPGVPPGASAGELRIRESARGALRRSGARPAEGGGLRADGVANGRRSADRTIGAVDLRPGDRRSFVLSVDPEDLTIDCRDTTAVVGAVARAVGENVVIYEDTLAPARGFSGADYRRLRDEFERVVFPVDTAYFGPPADIDGNGRVAILLTPEVNQMSRDDRGAFVGGFFLPTDLAESGDGAGNGSRAAGLCPVSNEAEVLYLPVPDPLGHFGRQLSRQRALRNARSVTAHEMEHLLSAEQRVFATPLSENENPFDDLESAWLSEALAHLSEEVVGLAAADLEERADLGFDAVVGASGEAREAFNAFHINNFARARLFLRNTNGTSAIADRDPSGRRSLEMRGFGWLFARFLGDRAAPPGSAGPLGGSAEHRLFQSLSRGGDERATGIRNVLRAARSVSPGGAWSWEGLLADFGMAVTAGGDSVTSARERRFRTWDLRDVFAGLHRNLPGDFREEYPLRVHALDFASTAVAFDLRASTAAYFRLAADSGSPTYAIRVESPDGDGLPAASVPQLLLVRVR